ncbi:MAG: radical SAM protein [Candidatus Marinimicrobia bacterium]|nr:radical SAM protein [Candidatus Neomarinimicrobiota bacterium]
MKIALIQAPVEDFYYTPQRSYPLGLSYLAGSVKDLPVEIEILDLITGYGRQTIPVPNSFKSIMCHLPYDRSPISAFHTYYHWGASWDTIENYFNENQFDLYAISSNFYTYSEEVLKLAKIIKSIAPDSIVLTGGQNTGPEHTLFTDCEDIDHCIMGEGEIAFREFVSILLENKKDFDYIPGIWNPKNKNWNKPTKTSDFIISPATELLPVEKYLIARESSIMISTSRGCPMGCRFCSISRTFGQKLRLKPVETILEEMQSAFNRGICVFDVEDDNFTFVKAHCIELLEQISRKFGGKITLYAMNGLSAEHLDEEIIDLLVKCGMKLLNLSIATSSEEQLKVLHRNTNIEHFKKITHYAAQKGLKIMGHFIAGLPGQALEEILETMKVLSELPIILGISPFYYIPGMDMKVYNIPHNCKEARLSRFWPAGNDLNEIDLITLFRLSRWLNYLKDILSKNNIRKIHFKEVSDMFSEDIFIRDLMINQELTGMSADNTPYSHQISRQVIDAFVKVFSNSYIHCA